MHLSLEEAQIVALSIGRDAEGVDLALAVADGQHGFALEDIILDRFSPFFVDFRNLMVGSFLVESLEDIGRHTAVVGTVATPSVDEFDNSACFDAGVEIDVADAISVVDCRRSEELTGIAVMLVMGKGVDIEIGERKHVLTSDCVDPRDKSKVTEIELQGLFFFLFSFVFAQHNYECRGLGFGLGEPKLPLVLSVDVVGVAVIVNEP